VMARNESEEAFFEILKAIGYFFAALGALIGFIFESIVWTGRRALVRAADSGPSRTVIPTHRGQRSGDRGQFPMSV
jgi:hypothetical protein